MKKTFFFLFILIQFYSYVGWPTIYVMPDLLHPEQEGMFEVHAYQNNADMAKEARLRPGDRAVMRGTLQQQSIELESGATTSINHFFVTYIEVISRSKRTSITAYEKEKKHRTAIIGKIKQSSSQNYKKLSLSP